MTIQELKQICDEAIAKGHENALVLVVSDVHNEHHQYTGSVKDEAFIELSLTEEGKVCLLVV